MVALNAHFDGKSIVLDDPASLPFEPGARLKITVEVVDKPKGATPVPRRFQPLNIRIDPDLSRAIASDPQFNIEES